MSNLSVVSFPADTPDQLVTDQVFCTPEQQQAAACAAVKTRARQRALDRSRRNTNFADYGPSVRQVARAQRRCPAGLPAKQVSNPAGPRNSRADGVPLRAYRRDTLSHRYRSLRSDHRSDCRKISQANQSRACDVAVRIVAAHGNVITIENCRIFTWAALWGTRIALFSPGMLVSALKRECAATGGQLFRAGTRSTALSQHCRCGQRVKKTLDQRSHDCAQCGLRGDRDVVSAMLVACVELTDAEDPRTARVGYELATVLRAWLAPRHERGGSVNRHQPPAPPDAVGPARTGSHHPVASAEHAALGPPPNRPGRKPGRRGGSRKRQPPKLFGAA